jgi:hypothetical protein
MLAQRPSFRLTEPLPTLWCGGLALTGNFGRVLKPPIGGGHERIVRPSVLTDLLVRDPDLHEYTCRE